MSITMIDGEEMASVAINNLSELADVDISNLQNGQVPTYNSTTQKWENQNVAGEQVQADWDETDSTAVDYIKNKPTIPTNTNQLTNGAGFITSSGSCASATVAGSLKSGSLSYCYYANNTVTLQGGSSGACWLTISGSAWKTVFQNDGNLVIYQNGTAKWSSGTSSQRFKHNIQDMTEERARKILDIRAVTFDWNDDQPVTTRQNDNAGVIAEEVSQVIPDLVVFEDTEDGKQIERRVEYERFTPYLIKMVQMQQNEIDLLKQQVSQQQIEIDLLKEEIRLLKERI